MARVLVIDDDNELRRALCEILVRAGHEAISAADGQAGIARYRRSLADVVITDIFMPKQDGLEIIREIHREFPEARIIVISGGGVRSNFDYLPAALKLGAWRTMEKPFRPSELLKAVAEAAESVAESTDRDFLGGTERILLVDDEAAIVKSLKRYLERLGYEVKAVMSATEALKAFHVAPDAFDLVITDQVLPGMTGTVLAREILKICGGMPIIVCSGYVNVFTVYDTETSGIREFMNKPFSSQDLARTVRRVLDADGA